jgi:RNA ligase
MTLYLSDLFSLEDFDREVADGYVNVREHPNEHLRIANYSSQTQYEYRWNPVTEQCRGLIYNSETLEVVSRPFAKFHNIDAAQTPTPPKGAAMIRSEKMDGSLGVLYRKSDGTLGIATRGSFTSDQAIHASHWLTTHMAHIADDGVVLRELWDPTRTYLFEIIYPSNRIVVDYGDLDALVLLDVIDNETGKSDLEAFDALDWPVKADKVLVPGGFYDTIFSDIPEGNEGFVLYWPHTGVRAKVKSAKYIELHRVVFGLSEKSIWETIRNGKTIDDILDVVPDELYGFVNETYNELTRKKLARYQEVVDAWYAITGNGSMPPMMTRKQFAEKSLKFGPLSKYLFKIADGADDAVILSMIWEELKPFGSRTARSQSEDVA